ncbi:hypothetical protein [Campylobacter showae]|uniref:hypothetical protein n=1 Tax=Campylobacter showae TaxID=204 RepID=UPI003B969200
MSYPHRHHGSSQYDKEKLSRLEKFLKSSDTHIDVHLVLSAGAKIEDMLEITTDLAFLDIAIPLDLSPNLTRRRVLATFFPSLRGPNKPVSFFSVGQGVPGPSILVAKKRILVRLRIRRDLAKGHNENQGPRN